VFPVNGLNKKQQWRDSCISDRVAQNLNRVTWPTE